MAAHKCRYVWQSRYHQRHVVDASGDVKHGSRISVRNLWASPPSRRKKDGRSISYFWTHNLGGPSARRISVVVHGFPYWMGGLEGCRAGATDCDVGFVGDLLNEELACPSVGQADAQVDSQVLDRVEVGV